VGRAKDMRKEVTDLLRGRPGWRLEPRTTPGASPVWCYVVGGEIEFSVAVEDGVIRLYMMDTDQEVVFAGADQLTAWLQTYKAHALQDVPARADGTTRAKRFFEWN
jgi:hypothetical protein